SRACSTTPPAWWKSPASVSASGWRYRRHDPRPRTARRPQGVPRYPAGRVDPRRHPHRPQWRVGGRGRPVRLGQDDPAEPHGRAGPAERGIGTHRRAAHRGPVRPPALRPARVSPRRGVPAVLPHRAGDRTMDGRLIHGVFLNAATARYPVTVLGWSAARSLGIADLSGSPRIWLG